MKRNTTRYSVFLLLLPLLLMLLFVPSIAQALPSVQVYADGATAGSRMIDGHLDKDTWFVPSGDMIDLTIVLSFGPKMVKAEDLYLLVTLPTSELASGTILVDGMGIGDADSVEDPSVFIGDNHFPLNNPDDYDYFAFLIEDLVEKPTISSSLPDYNAETGIITTKEDAYGEIIDVVVSLEGFSYAHFDAYATFFEQKKKDPEPVSLGYISNPGSHDVSDPAPVPEPATMLLFGTGLVGLAGLGRRKIFKKR